MSLGKLLNKGLGVALDAPVLRTLSSDLAGHIVAGAAGPVYRAIHQHFTLSGNDLAVAFGDSFARGLGAIDDELNGSRIGKALGPKLQRSYQSRIREHFLEPFVAEHSLDDGACRNLCKCLRDASGPLVKSRDRIFLASELPEPDIPELINGDVSGVSALILDRVSQVHDPLPEEARAFLVYRDLLGDAVLFFFRETLRRDPRVEATLNALQQAGLRQDARGLDEKLVELKQQQREQQSEMMAALQASDNERMNAVMPVLNQLSENVKAIELHATRLNTFHNQFSDWSAYLEVRLDDLQQALVGEVRQVGEAVREVGDDVREGFDSLKNRFDALMLHLQDFGLGDRIQPDDEFSPPPDRLVREVERTTAELRASTQYRARASLVEASVLAAAGNTLKAEQKILEAIEDATEDTDRALAYYNLFQVYLQRGDTRIALDHLKKAAGFDPSYALWREGKHVPEKILGAGGMGLALLVRNRLDQQRVLKLLWSNDAEAAERFHQEALTMTRIAGDHVPAVSDFDYVDPMRKERPYLEMEYLDHVLDGESWLEAHGSLTLEQGLDVGCQVAEVLSIAHAKGIHHYDLKPANLLLEDTGSGIKVRVIDFGLSSKVMELRQRIGRGSMSGKSVMAQQVFGSLDYAPPEQRGQGGTPGPWSDMYGLAITLYRLMTGAPANPPNPFLMPGEREVQEVLFRCLHHRVGERPTAEQFLELLRAFRQVESGVSAAGAIEVASVSGWSADDVKSLQARTARSLSLQVSFCDSLRDGAKGPRMIVIPAGIFQMGSPEHEDERQDDERLHEVTIERPFAMGKFPVTFVEYDRFCAATGRDQPDDPGWGRDNRPVINVDWNDAVNYCQWLSEQTGAEYRLPTEAEWEYACRAGSRTPFWFGETISTAQANYHGDFTYGTGSEGRYLAKTTPVGSYPENSWGLCDMHGNVWEWTGSVYAENYDGSELICAPQQNDRRRALRGGSWNFSPDWVRSAYRDGYHPAYRLVYIGFRLSRTI